MTTIAELPADLLNSLLDHWPVGRLATLTPAGAPHVLPVVFVAAHGCVCSPVDAKRKAGRTLARVKNIRAHGRASLLLDGYRDDWSRLWWVRLDGPARVETRDDDLLGSVEQRLREKYPQYRTVSPYAGPPTLLVLRLERISAWTGSGDLAAIREAAEGQGHSPAQVS